MISDDLLKLKKLSSDLYAYYSEDNNDLNELIDNIFDYTIKLEGDITPLLLNKSICPKCKSELTPRYYKGYYDEFPYWSCMCHSDDEFFTQNTYRGAYT